MIITLSWLYGRTIWILYIVPRLDLRSTLIKMFHIYRDRQLADCRAIELINRSFCYPVHGIFLISRSCDEGGASSLRVSETSAGFSFCTFQFRRFIFVGNVGAAFMTCSVNPPPMSQLSVSIFSPVANFWKRVIESFEERETKASELTFLVKPGMKNK